MFWEFHTKIIQQQNNKSFFIAKLDLHPMDFELTSHPPSHNFLLEKINFSYKERVYKLDRLEISTKWA